MCIDYEIYPKEISTDCFKDIPWNTNQNNTVLLMDILLP